MLKKSFSKLAYLAALLAVATPSIAASTFHLVVPLSRVVSSAPTDAIVVSLADAVLPSASANQEYSHSLLDYLIISGDSSLDKSAARWSLVDGTLPAGLALNATTGVVAGTPATKTTAPASFAVQASYKGSDGIAVYTIEVGGKVLDISHISLGAQHSCAITSAGGVKCWGAGSNGQLGNNSLDPSLVPVAVSSLDSGVVSLSVGYRSSCAITNDGIVKCWGLNNYGQLGNNSTTNSSVPVDVAGLGRAKAVSVGASHACVILADDSVSCWGENSYGQLGIGSTTRSLAVQAVQGLGSVRAISAGQNHTCAVLNNGAVKCWGWNTSGQLGDGSTTTRTSPVNVSITDVSSISAGDYHTCALTVTGAKCWGHNEYGQLGNGLTSTTPSKTPVVVKLGDLKAISAGGLSTCGLTNPGNVHCFGNNLSGTLGDGSTSNRASVMIVTLSEASDISMGQSYACAKLVDGSTKCWGHNNAGQLGNNSKTNSLLPVEVQALD